MTHSLLAFGVSNQVQLFILLSSSQNLYSGDPTWINLTENAKGKIAGFVDFDWGANICPKNDCGKDLEVGAACVLFVCLMNAFHSQILLMHAS